MAKFTASMSDFQSNNSRKIVKVALAVLLAILFTISTLLYAITFAFVYDLRSVLINANSTLSIFLTIIPFMLVGFWYFVFRKIVNTPKKFVLFLLILAVVLTFNKVVLNHKSECNRITDTGAEFTMAHYLFTFRCGDPPPASQFYQPDYLY